jgi:hypothetical protein
MKAKHPENEYAVWTIPGTAFSVWYWLSLFHEIDFQVNEAYRRIPHGGMEIGGLLFGRADESSARIEAFRAIACEHSRGPSFVLSDRDLNGLREQLGTAASDPDLQGLDVLGWFISHTRSQLEVNERERGLFDELFPGPAKLTILIKPERFQPTRFAFFARNPDGALAGNGDDAIILPLPGRASGAAPLASIPAPSSESARERQETETAEPAVSDEKGARVAPVLPDRASEVAITAVLPEPVSAPIIAPQPAAESLPSIEEIRRKRAEAIRKPHPGEARAAAQQAAEATPTESRRTNARLAVVLFVAAALGCVVGYFIYLQLPPAVIPLNIEKRAAELVVSWPPEQTRDATYAALRVDDGDPIVLSTEQKSDGQAAIHSAGGNVKIELVAQHWMRDSHGFLRYVEALAASPGATASQ